MSVTHTPRFSAFSDMLFSAKVLRKLIQFSPAVSEIFVFKVLLTTRWHRVSKTECCFFWSTKARDV